MVTRSPSYTRAVDSVRYLGIVETTAYDEIIALLEKAKNEV
jgi:hypothetical protein